LQGANTRLADATPVAATESGWAKALPSSTYHATYHQGLTIEGLLSFQLYSLAASCMSMKPCAYKMILTRRELGRVESLLATIQELLLVALKRAAAANKPR
jgi:hypothetical protein